MEHGDFGGVVDRDDVHVVNVTKLLRIFYLKG